MWSSPKNSMGKTQRCTATACTRVLWIQGPIHPEIGSNGFGPRLPFKFRKGGASVVKTCMPHTRLPMSISNPTFIFFLSGTIPTTASHGRTRVFGPKSGVFPFPESYTGVFGTKPVSARCHFTWTQPKSKATWCVPKTDFPMLHLNTMWRSGSEKITFKPITTGRHSIRSTN